ncbi:MAG: DUF938 domain-containing protein [Deltaproteobacteria bacterium]|nr:DUF938 domain-containing protein [Deltaproteobacteria bacterium]
MKLNSPSSLRNRDVILDVLRTCAPTRGFALETSAGSGHHSVHFAAAFPELQWQPTDLSDEALRSIAAFREEAALPNLLAPQRLDVTDATWAPCPDGADLVVSINMIHISPWETAVGLFAGAARVLRPGGVLFTYGPYLVDGEFTAPSNERFEGWLKSLDPSYGQRDLDALNELATAGGLVREQLIPMPANNFSVIYRKPA